jgi:pSer/pThr/pTyr-binding forkhead associated (FHA) protein
MLKIQYCDRRQESVWLVDSKFTIGQNSDNSMVIDSSGVSDYHAEIYSENNQLSIKPLSTNITKVNQKQIHNPTLLKPGDIIAIAEIELEIIDPQANQIPISKTTTDNSQTQWKLRSTASWMEGKNIAVKSRMVIGRESNCDIPIPIEHLSRKHAELFFEGNQLYIKDLNSSNGTYLNGKKISKAKLNPGDKIKLDVVSFEIIGPEHDPNKTIIRTLPSNESSMNNASIGPKGTVKSQKTYQVHSAVVDSSKKERKSPASINKKLVAEHTGQQEWIKKNKSESKSSSFIWIAVAGFAITITVAFLFFYK